MKRSEQVSDMSNHNDSNSQRSRLSRSDLATRIPSYLSLGREWCFSLSPSFLKAVCGMFSESSWHLKKHCCLTAVPKEKKDEVQGLAVHTISRILVYVSQPASTWRQPTH